MKKYFGFCRKLPKPKNPPLKTKKRYLPGKFAMKSKLRIIIIRKNKKEYTCEENLQ